MKWMKLFLLIVISSSFSLQQCKEDNTKKANPVDSTDNNTTFKNPLLPSGPDPWIYKADSVYYYTHTLGDRIGIIKTKSVSELATGTFKTVWNPPATGIFSKNIWAPELHFLENKWYVYFAADDGSDSNHRLFVLENSSLDPLQGNWELKGKISDLEDRWAIDGSVFNYQGANYFIWSGWKGTNNPGEQQIYIAKITNPWTVEGTRVMISEPTYTWEKNGFVNEGPEVLKNNRGEVFLFYSASGCWTDSYSLGMLSLKKGGNPLTPGDWIKSPAPILSTNASNNAYAPGHNGFFKSPDGKEDWIIYHANSSGAQGCSNKRNPRMQKILWSTDSVPSLGEPVKINTEIVRPSGEVD
jgi:GH43 family beta-xylosidase